MAKAVKGDKNAFGKFYEIFVEKVLSQEYMFGIIYDTDKLW